VKSKGRLGTHLISSYRASAPLGEAWHDMLRCGQVVIDAFRTINPQLMLLNQEPRQTTSNIGHLNKPSIQVPGLCADPDLTAGFADLVRASCARARR
jgi:hypothetical protein